MSETYVYSSQKLQAVLIEMRKRLEIKDRMAHGNSYIRRKIGQIDAVLTLDYFDRYMMKNGEVVYLTRVDGCERAELIRKVKIDRDKLIESRDFFMKINKYHEKEAMYGEMQKQVEITLAQIDEPDSILFDMWEQIEKCNEFKALKAEYEKFQYEIDRRRWLLGMIHHPEGYFKKALEVG